MSINIAKLLIIDEADSGSKSENFKLDFVYNYFEKSEREFINSNKKLKSLNGNPLSVVPRYIKISFDRHSKEDYDVLPDGPLKNFIDSEPSLETILSKNTNAIKYEEKISADSYFNLMFQDKKTSDGFYKSLNDEVLSTSSNIAQTGLLIQETPSVTFESLVSNQDGLTTSFIQDTDFYQPWDFSIYYAAASKFHSGTFNKLDNVRINTRVSTKYVKKIINNVVADGASPFSDEMKILQDGWGYIKDLPIRDSTEDYHDFDPEGTSTQTKTSVIGYIIEKYENKMTGNVTKNKNELIKHPSIYIKGTENIDIIDRHVRYGGSYEYNIRTVVAVITNDTITQGDDKFNADLLKILVSAGTSKRSIYCSERISPLPPTSLFFQYNFKKDALLVNWEFPFNKQQDIKRFQIYRRDSLTSPFSLLREYNFDDSTETDGFSPASGNPNNIRKKSSPVCFFYDGDFNEESKYIYAVASIDARGLTSGYSDQFLVSYDRFINKTQAKFISRSGAPKPYPNIFLEQDALSDVIKEDKAKKINIYFNPECMEVTKSQLSEDGSVTSLPSESIVKDGTYASSGSYTFQIINIETQEQSSVKFSITKEDFLTAEEQLILENTSYTSGIWCNKILYNLVFTKNLVCI